MISTLNELTNITFVVNEWKNSNFRFALTRKFTQPWAMSAGPSVVTRITGTWAKAKKGLNKLINMFAQWLCYLN